MANPTVVSVQAGGMNENMTVTIKGVNAPQTNANTMLGVRPSLNATSHHASRQAIN